MVELRRVPTAETDLAAIAEGTTSQKFLELLAAREFESLVATMASDAQARFLLPHGLEEYAGGEAIVRRIESWFGSASVFDLTSSSEETVGSRHRLSWRFSVVRDGGPREVIEQLVYLNLGPQGIGNDGHALLFEFLPVRVHIRENVAQIGRGGCRHGSSEVTSSE